ncbi:unnamed protein product [Camellia sinensis]
MGLLNGYTYFVFLHHRHDLHPPQLGFALLIGFWAQRRVVFSCGRKSCVVDRYYGSNKWLHLLVFFIITISILSLGLLLPTQTVIRFWAQRRALAGIKAAGNVLIKLDLSVNVGIFRCQVRTHPPSDGLHFIVMDANLWPNKGPAPELTWFQIFGFEHEDIPDPVLNFVSMPEDFNMQNSQPPYSLREIQETRIVDSDLEGQNRTTLDDELDRNLPFQLPLASGPAELPSHVTDHGFGFMVEDIPITGWPNLQQPWSGENIGELDFPLVAEGPGMQNSQLLYSGDGKIYRSPQLHAFSKTSGVLSISKGDFPHVLEEDISIPGLSNPQLPNSVPWPVLETQETRIVGSDLEGQNRTTLDDELHQNPPFPDGTIGNFWTTNQLPLASGPAELPSYPTDHGFGFTVEDVPITGWPNLQQPWSGDVPWAVLETQETRIVSSDLQGQKPTTAEQDKLIQPSLGIYAGNTSQPLPRLPDHEETYNHEVLPSPPCEKAELSSSEGKGRTYKKFSFEEMEKLIKGVEKYGRKCCNWKTIKNLYFEDSDRSKDQLKRKVETHEEICKQANRSPSKEALYAGVESPDESSKIQIIQVQAGEAPKLQFRKSINIYLYYYT